ncbi:hypothetical protein D3C75_1091340 [compost metagenome]
MTRLQSRTIKPGGSFKYTQHFLLRVLVTECSRCRKQEYNIVCLLHDQMFTYNLDPPALDNRAETHSKARASGTTATACSGNRHVVHMFNLIDIAVAFPIQPCGKADAARTVSGQPGYQNFIWITGIT